MCGISGYLDLNSGVRTDTLRKMNNAARHRGPDDEGYVLISPSGVHAYGGDDTTPSLFLPKLETADGQRAFLGLGHRRLSILDLSDAGHQPMLLPEREIAVSYNGEIYNFPELRAELQSRGYSFRTSCDTEALLYAYCEWGEDCLEHFNGMWSFALWDGASNKLFCARDRLGAKPFHYLRDGNRFLFASELKQLCQDGAFVRRFDRSYLAANLIYSISDYNEQTLVEGMRQLLPGHKLVIRVSGDRRRIESLRVEPYWTLEPQYDDSLTMEEWCGQVTEEFSRSCRWRMRSDAPLAALLSGGLDSSCMVTEVCGQMEDPSRLHTFTTSYPGHTDCDEWRFADAVNRACGCQGHLITPDPSDAIERRFEKSVWTLEGFGGLALIGTMMLLDDIHDRGFKVVLNGQCGDETMFGYERYYAFYFADLLKTGRLRAMLREYRLAARHSAISAAGLLQMALYFNLPVVRDTRKLSYAQRFVKRELLEARNTEELHALLYPHSLPHLQKTELTATQLPHIVRYDDRIYMAASIESRIPFMDYRFVELAARIPASLKIKDGYTKSIMRRIFDARMPEEVTWRTNKMGFDAPAKQWAALFSRDYLEDLADHAKTAPYFRVDRLKETISSGVATPEMIDFMQAEQFARQFGVS